MKKTKNRIVILLVFTFFINLFVVTSVRAYENNTIKIDGEFKEWNDKPVIYDKEGDAPIAEDIHQVRFFVSDDYLFLKIKRNINYSLKGHWNFEVLMVDTPSGKKTTEYIYKNNKLTSISITSFQVSVYKIKNKGKDEFIVSVSKDKVPVETFFSASKDGGDIEFRLPLNLLGIQGPSKNIKFIIKSNLNAKSSSEMEFVPDSGVALISMVPALGSIYIQLFIFLFIVVIIKALEPR